MAHRISQDESRRLNNASPRCILTMVIIFVGQQVWLCPSIVFGDDFFLQRVAPILEQHCLNCHSDQEQKGGFSLQSAKSFFESGHVSAGDSQGSELLQWIAPADGQAEMPKDSTPLTQEQIGTIETWINSGANWPESYELSLPSVDDFDWWSFRPIALPEVPMISGSHSSWLRTSIDAFIVRRLEQEGLIPSPMADRRTLIRRLSYDLTGLPPTDQEVRDFVDDVSANAYEKVVDRLLKSKHYGERWARHWLDVVKYADTCGYDKDKLRPNAWPYRDYVIRSFNEDKRYSRFIEEQIAGDALFPGEPDGILGLGFLAAGPWDFIGHVEVPESKIDGKVARNLDRDDVVSNTLNTFCSVTVQCARCHNHKFDPITQDDYYGLQAIFSAIDRAERVYAEDPEIQSKRKTINAELARLNSLLHAETQGVDAETTLRQKELEASIQQLKDGMSLRKEPAFGYHSKIARDPTTEKWIQLEFETARKLSRIVLRPAHDDYAGIGAGFGFPVQFKVMFSLDATEWETVYDQTDGDFANPGIAPLTIEFSEPVEAVKIRVTATKLVERKEDYIFALAEVEVFDESPMNIAPEANIKALDSIEAPQRWQAKNLTDGKWPHYSDPQKARRLASVHKEYARLREEIDTPERRRRRQTLEKQIDVAEKQLSELPVGKVVYAAATNFKPQSNFKPTNGVPRNVHVLHRGDVTHPLYPAVPSILRLHGSDNDPVDTAPHTAMRAEMKESQRRAILAHWLSSEDNPLVWRSLVNRVWQYHFGQGIVATPNDFGRMGAVPTHPELLDWLASEFLAGGQSLKSLHKLIVMSAVYQQSSQHNARNARIDASNRFLWRANRRRLEAEEIRDSLLAVSGSLNTKMGGPGYYLFELEKTEHSPHFEYHKFDPTDVSTHRRSIYRFIARSQPDPWMATLDCADSSQSTPVRTETLTSLQALSLLNNRFNLVMAEKFSQRLQREASGNNEQVKLAIRLLLQRNASKRELMQLTEYVENYGMRNTCRVLFNLSEFVFLD